MSPNFFPPPLPLERTSSGVFSRPKKVPQVSADLVVKLSFSFNDLGCSYLDDYRSALNFSPDSPYSSSTSHSPTSCISDCSSRSISPIDDVGRHLFRCLESLSPTEDKPQIRQNLYKTELCRSWLESHHCRYGSKCQFAHGEHELRPVQRHPRYKSMQCVTFHTVGTCAYGQRCRFSHYEDSPLVNIHFAEDKRLPVFKTMTTEECACMSEISV
mmetsp:Transcript_45669/g.74474  ORF Transcript_45669/g.74474 Transcript_45669/m.74474 type:complete len:214 (+) Transcript_45669:285-926(+)